MLFIRFLARFPPSFLYLLADFLFVVAYYLLRYRKDVVRKNLGIAFPEMSDAERKKVVKNFYRNLADVIVETLMAITMKKDEMVRRVTFSNIDQLEDCKARGLSTVALATHQCNWEWMLLSGTVHFPYHVVGVYKPLSNKKMDDLMLEVRSRFGTEMVSSERIVRNIARHREDLRAIGLIGDQRPILGGKKLWTKMFNQDTAFHSGVEFVPKMENAAVFMARMKRLKRGRYHLDMIKLCEPPYDAESKTQIIDKYVNELESMIKENPSDWLWSHDRWKYTKEESAAYDARFEKTKSAQ